MEIRPLGFFTHDPAIDFRKQPLIASRVSALGRSRRRAASVVAGGAGTRAEHPADQAAAPSLGLEGRWEM